MASSVNIAAVLATAGALALAVRTTADVFHLTSGGIVVGDLIETVDGQYRIRAAIGEVRLPVGSVERIEPAPSIFAEYDERRGRAADTAEEQTALAAWCDERGLRAETKRHLSRALELDGDYEPARRMAGFVKVGGVWVEARSAVEPRESGPEKSARKNGKPEAAKDPERAAAETPGQWLRRIRAISAAFLSSREKGRFEDGRGRILEIRDPLAIVPLATVLSRGRVAERELLVEALSRFPEDEATLNLAAVLLLDPDPRVRRAAITELSRRNDPRVAAQLRKALSSERDLIVRHAAEALGAMKVREAVPDLIPALTARRRKFVEVPVERYFRELSDTFVPPQRGYVVGGNNVAGPPIIGVSAPADSVENEWQLRNVTVFRTEVLEALRALTDVDFGFEVDEWQTWYKEQTP